jgi:hypothetical protein
MLLPELSSESEPSLESELELVLSESADSWSISSPSLSSRSSLIPGILNVYVYINLLCIYSVYVYYAVPAYRFREIFVGLGLQKNSASSPSNDELHTTQGCK